MLVVCLNLKRPRKLALTDPPARVLACVYVALSPLPGFEKSSFSRSVFRVVLFLVPVLGSHICSLLRSRSRALLLSSLSLFIVFMFVAVAFHTVFSVLNIRLVVLFLFV